MSSRKAGPPAGDPPVPVALEAERAILGAILVHNEALDKASEILEPADFYRQAHGRIFAAMLALGAAALAIDLLTLCDALRKAGDLEEVGGPAAIAALADGVPRSANAAHYAGIVKEKARQRSAIETGRRLVKAAQEGERPAAEIVTDAAEKLLEMGGAAMAGRPIRIRDLMSSGVEAIEKSQASEGGYVTGLPTGFTELDEMTAGLQPSDLILVAARTSQGKTALAMNIARYAASICNVLVFSLEMSRQQLFVRLLAAEARVNSHHLRTGSLAEEDWPRIAAAMQSLHDARLFIDDTPNIGVREVRARARQVRNEEGGLGLVVVDYLQLMRGRGRFDNRTQEIGTISRGLKGVAKELGLPLIALAQLSRAPEAGGGRKARRPQLHDLRESGDLENDADVVIMIYRPEAKDDERQDLAELILAKQRNGPTGSIKVAWSAACVSFDNFGML